jgi:hypothetical protein
VSQLVLVASVGLFKYARRNPEFVELSKNFCLEKTTASGPSTVKPLVPINWIAEGERPSSLPITSSNQAHFKNATLQTVRVLQGLLCRQLF